MHRAPHQNGYIQPLLAQCWASVADGGPTSIQHWFNLLFLLNLDNQGPSNRHQYE